MKSFYKILFLLVAGSVIFIFAGPIKNVKWFRHLFIGLHAVFLTYCTLFIFNRPEWRWAEESGLLEKVSNTESKKAYEFTRNNFLLIDNSFDKMLLPNPEGDESDSTALVVTNRRTLANFLHLLNEQSANVDLVIVDLGFNNKTSDDSLLKAEMLKLYAENKIILSLDPGHTETIRMIENPRAYGNISEKGKKNLFTSHSIFNDGYYSLPYRVYCILGNKTPGKLFFQNKLFREKSIIRRSGIAVNTFFPEFRMANETLLRGQEVGSTNSVLDNLEEGSVVDSRTYYYLSQPLSDLGKTEFVNNLQQRKKGGKKNVIFIGAFASPDEDIHQTFYGNLHGATIILNIIFSMQEKSHILRFSYVFFLLLGYWVLSLVLFYKGLGIEYRWPERLKVTFNPLSKKNKSDSVVKNKPKKDPVLEWLKTPFSFIVNYLFVKELPITLLVLFSAFTLWIFGQWPNILPLLIYITGVKASLDFYVKKVLNKNYSPK